MVTRAEWLVHIRDPEVQRRRVAAWRASKATGQADTNLDAARFVLILAWCVDHEPTPRTWWFRCPRCQQEFVTEDQGDDGRVCLGCRPWPLDPPLPSRPAATDHSFSLREAARLRRQARRLSTVEISEEGMTLEEIGVVLGTTRERARQIEAGALRHLEQVAGTRLYPFFYDRPDYWLVPLALPPEDEEEIGGDVLLSRYDQQVLWSALGPTQRAAVCRGQRAALLEIARRPRHGRLGAAPDPRIDDPTTIE